MGQGDVRSFRLDVEFVDTPTELESNLSELLSKPWSLDNEQDDVRTLRLTMKPNTFAAHLGNLSAVVTYKDGIGLVAGESKTVGLTIVNNIKAYGNEPLTAKIKMHLPSDFESEETAINVAVPCWTAMTKMAHTEEIPLTFKVNKVSEPKENVILEIELPEHGTTRYVSVTFLKRK